MDLTKAYDEENLLSPADRAREAFKLDTEGYIPDDLYDFVEIPKTPYFPGFLIGKYPVTNLQYARFLKPENFKDKELWLDFPKYAWRGENFRYLGTTGFDGWEWIKQALEDEDKQVEDGVLYPGDWQDAKFGCQRATVPVVSISWWETNAYCKWLHKHWDELEEGQRNLPKPEFIRLPIENEWVQAAGGDAGYRYAFGNLNNPAEEIFHYCNTKAKGILDRIGSTTPVWMYPQGKTRQGVMDMSGNVWEMQANYLNSKQDLHALHGGSWANTENMATVSYTHFSLIQRFFSIGFRMVANPV